MIRANTESGIGTTNGLACLTNATGTTTIRATVSCTTSICHAARSASWSLIGCVYELNGEDSRTLAAVVTFRVLPERELNIDHNTLHHLRDQGLVEPVGLGGDKRGLVLTKEGRGLLEPHILERGDEATQAFYAGVSRPREIDHDSNFYATYREEEARLQEKHADLQIRRVICATGNQPLRSFSASPSSPCRRTVDMISQP